MAIPRRKDTEYDLEITSLDELERSVVAGEPRDEPRAERKLPPSAVERSQRCESSQRELLRNRMRFNIE